MPLAEADKWLTPLSSHARPRTGSIPAKYSETGSVLEALPLHADVLSDLSELDAATNERTQAERAGNPAIGPGELLFGVPAAQIVNAAFCHPGPHGSRFNSPYR